MALKQLIGNIGRVLEFSNIDEVVNQGDEEVKVVVQAHWTGIKYLTLHSE